MDPWDENGIFTIYLLILFTYIFGCLFFTVNYVGKYAIHGWFWVLGVMMSCKHSAKGDTSGRSYELEV